MKFQWFVVLNSIILTSSGLIKDIFPSNCFFKNWSDYDGFTSHISISFRSRLKSNQSNRFYNTFSNELLWPSGYIIWLAAASLLQCDHLLLWRSCCTARFARSVCMYHCLTEWLLRWKIFLRKGTNKRAPSTYTCTCTKLTYAWWISHFYLSTRWGRWRFKSAKSSKEKRGKPAEPQCVSWWQTKTSPEQSSTQ